MIIPNQKIRVFISSACEGRYSLVRAGLKALIEATQLADVYAFESEGASTGSARHHYEGHLKDCDVCIFLIDNKDGIRDGVQKEIDIVKKHGIKAFYYFCDESSKEKTPLQKSLTGEEHAKTYVVHSFEELIQTGARDLINDMVFLYSQHCKGRVGWREGESDEGIDNIFPSGSTIFAENIAGKELLTSIDCCKDYFSHLILERPLEKKTNSNAIDRLCADFLPVLFEGAPLDKNKLELLKGELKKQQPPSHYLVTKKRLDAIVAYFSGDQDGCLSILDEALKLAKSKSLPSWIVKDILIDLRNQQGFLGESQNCYSLDNKYQKELNESDFITYYPLIDRFERNYYRKLVEKWIKYKIQSPYTITFGHDLGTFVDLLASSYVFAMFNGSLTHLQLLYRRIMVLTFYFSQRYSNWNLKTLLLKTTIVNYDSKEIDGIISFFGDILGKMNATDAYDIYRFAENKPIAYQKLCAKLEAFRITGYFLDDDQFASVWEEIYKLICDWLEDSKDSNAPIVVGNHIFLALRETYLRIDQDLLVDFIYRCLKLPLQRFYDELFGLISECVNLNKLTKESSQKLLSSVIEIVSNEKERKNIYFDSIFSSLWRLRKQNRELTEELDKVISESMPDFYEGEYTLETTEDEAKMPLFIEKYVAEIITRNKTQGEGGRFTGYADRPHQIIEGIMQKSALVFEDDLIDSVFKVSYETLLRERQTIDVKMDAIDLMIFLIKSFSGILDRDSEIVLGVLSNKAVVETGTALITNLREVDLKLYALLLYSCLGEDINTDIIEVLAHIGDNELSQIKASQAFLHYLSMSSETVNPKLESTIIQNAVKWCNSSNLTVRWYAVRILFELLRNSNNKNIVCNQLVRLMDTDNVYIKNFILRRVYRLKDIDVDTYDYIIQKATLDTNFVVRKVVEDISKEHD